MEASAEDARRISEAMSFSMTSIERMWALLQAVKYIEAAKIPGDVVECGVWKGGSSFLAASHLASVNSLERNLWLYDTFEGMVQPTDKDIRSNGKSADEMLVAESGDKKNSLIWAVAHEEEVKANLRKSGYPESKMNFIKGDVVETLTSEVPDRISLLRLDTDWYESTRVELETLAPLVSKGGVIIVDDYGDWSGARSAVDEYLSGMKISPLVHRIDFTGRIWIAD